MKGKTIKLSILFLGLLILIAGLPANVFASDSQAGNYIDISAPDSESDCNKKNELLLEADNTVSKYLIHSSYNHYTDSAFSQVIETSFANHIVNEDGVNYHLFEVMEILLLLCSGNIILTSVFKFEKRKDDVNG